MSRASNLLGGVDSRPRVWIWIEQYPATPERGPYRWATHPAGHGEAARTAGEAFSAVLDAFGPSVPLVILWGAHGRPGWQEEAN